MGMGTGFKGRSSKKVDKIWVENGEENGVGLTMEVESEAEVGALLLHLGHCVLALLFKG